MSIRYKFFGAFSIVVALACGLALYGFRGISTTGELVVSLYDGPLIAINYARSAQSVANQARLLLRRDLGEMVPRESAIRFEELLAEIAVDLEVVRDRVKNEDVTIALERAESRLRVWSEAELKIIHPPLGGLTAVPAAYSVGLLGENALVALDDLVETVAAYGFGHRMEAEARVAEARAAMLALALGTIVTGLLLATAFAFSMSKPIFSAMRIAGRVAGGNFDDRIDNRRRDEFGHLLTSLAVMQARLKARAEEDQARALAGERLARMLAALNASSEAIMRTKTREQLYKLVCDAAANGAEFVSTAFALADADSNSLDIVAATGPAADTVRELTLSTAPDVTEGRGLAGTAFRTRQPCVSNDYLADDRGVAFHSLARTMGILAAAAVPVLGRSKTLGVLLFQSTERGVFTPELVELLQRLAANVSFALEDFDRVDERERAEEEIKYLATHDSLTDLPNRAMFNQLLGFSIATARRHERKCAVLFIDLDRFKFVNDSLGHAAGDKLLVEMASRLRSGVRASDVVARLGGDEFVILLNDITEGQQVARVARDLLKALSKPMNLGGQECSVTASIGGAMFPADGDDELTLMKNADIAMYLAKQEGKNDIRFFSNEIKTQSADRLMLETGLRRALERNEFFLEYQPKQSVASGQIVGVEALLR